MQGHVIQQSKVLLQRLLIPILQDSKTRISPKLLTLHTFLISATQKTTLVDIGIHRIIVTITAIVTDTTTITTMIMTIQTTTITPIIPAMTIQARRAIRVRLREIRKILLLVVQILGLGPDDLAFYVLIVGYSLIFLYL